MSAAVMLLAGLAFAGPPPADSAPNPSDPEEPDPGPQRPEEPVPRALEEEAPLAIPVSPSPSPPRPTRVDATGPPLAIPEARAPRGSSRAIREYRAQYLAVLRLSEIATGTTWDAHWRGSWYGPYGGWSGWHATPHPWAYRVDSWAVFKGGHRIDVPTTLAALGQPAEQRAVEKRIRAQRTTSTALYGVGVVGVVTTVVGLIGNDQATTFDERRDWNALTLAGAGLTVGGLVGGAIPGGRARRLQYVHEATLDVGNLQRRIADHNEALAAELGLDLDYALTLEQ